MTNKHWKTLSEETVFDASPFLTISKQHVQLPNGVEIDDFYQVNLRHFALVVPVTDAGNVIALEGYRHGSRSIEINFPGGFLDPGEDAATAVARELAEEAGYACDTLKELATTIDNSNQKGATGTYFVGHGAKQTGHQVLEETEDFTLRSFTPAELDQMLKDGAFGTTHTVVAWAHARMHL